MNENDAITTTEEVTEADLQVFDEEWDDAQSDAEEAEPAAEPAAEEAAQEEDAESDSEEAQGSEQESGEQAEAETEAQDEAGEEDQLFTLKYMGEEKKVTREEMQDLAQKGMDYERVRQERDSFKDNPKMPADYSALQAQAGYLKEIADLAGTSVEELVLRTRANRLMREDNSLSEMDAVIKARSSMETSPKADKAEEAAPDEEAQSREQVKAFLEAYPGVKAEDIPEEVWKDAFAHNGDLTGAYSRFENRQLKAQIAQMKQSQQNKSRSTGSRKSAGAASKRDPFDEAWDS